MISMRKTNLVSCVLLFACLGLGSASPAEELVTGKINDVIDGNTYKAYFNGSVVMIRLIGVELPSLKQTRSADRSEAQLAGGKRLAKEARTFALKQIYPGRTVYLEFDRDKKDRYNRFLVYLWLDAERKEMLNEVLLEEGYGKASFLPPNTKYKKELLEAQEKAKFLGKGIWKKPGGS
jgi:micrococcal nuclease